MRVQRFEKSGALVLAAALLIAACTSGSQSADDADDGSSTSTALSATGPSPGVTDDAIRVGVTYVDTESLVALGLNYDLGDHEAVYNALFDALNADGGINGRQIEPVYASVDPSGPGPAEEACVKLTEDEDVFVVTGFFLDDAVSCPVVTHQTAVVGGDMTPQRTDQAQAPWLAWAPDTGQTEAVLRALGDQGELDGNVAVWAEAQDQDEVDDIVLPTLDDLGVQPVETGITDAPADDTAAIQSSVKTIAQRFEAADADTLVIVGRTGTNWPTYMADDSSYRPKLLFLNFNAPNAFVTNAATTDTSVLDGSLVGGGYGPDQARFEEPAMQECIQTLTDAGIDTPAPEDVGDDPSNQPYQAAFQACPDLALLRAWLEEAGPNLNYGTLAAAADGLQVTIPGDPEERTYGSPPDADGAPAAYLFSWDTADQTYQLFEGTNSDTTTTTGN